MSDIQNKNITIAIKALMQIAGERLLEVSTLEYLHEAESIARRALDEMRTNGMPALLRELGFL